MLRRSIIKSVFFAAVVFIAGCGMPAGEAPRVLIIGDSISLGYTPYVESALAGQAVVVHSAGNSQDSRNGVKNIESWVGSGKWDVISFNFGLWDLCYRLPGPITLENRDKVSGVIAVPLDEYERNLYQVAARLKATGAKVVFQTTTFVPDAEPGRNAADVARYNDVAARVMKRFGIHVNDLNAVSAGLDAAMRESNTDVHYADLGYAELAKSVARSIKTEL